MIDNNNLVLWVNIILETTFEWIKLLLMFRNYILKSWKKTLYFLLLQISFFYELYWCIEQIYHSAMSSVTSIPAQLLLVLLLGHTWSSLFPQWARTIWMVSPPLSSPHVMSEISSLNAQDVTCFSSPVGKHRDARFASKLGQIGIKWDKSGFLFRSDFSAFWSEKKPRVVKIWPCLEPNLPSLVKIQISF